MKVTNNIFETDVLESALDLASWNRPRTSEELRSFVESHHAALPTDIELV